MIDPFRLVRTGKVSSINYKEATARIEFHNEPGVFSKELKVVTSHTNKEKNYSMPSIGEDVVCIFPSNTNSDGYILGSYHDGKNLPGITGKVKYIFFPDGTKLKYDMETHTLEADCVGEINIKSGSVVNIKAEEVNIEASNLNFKANASSFNHKIACEDITTEKGSYNDHIDKMH